MTVETRTDWRDLPPVDESEQPQIPERPSQTLLKLHDRCDRSAMLYLIYRAGAGSHELNRGAAVHDVIAELTQKHIVEGGKNVVPPEEGKDALLAYFEENPHLQMHAAERDAARYMIANWCLGSWFDPPRVIAVETTLTMEIGGFTIVGRVDLAETLGPAEIAVTDYKTSFDMGSSDEFASQSFDSEGNPRFAGNFQTQLYALLLAKGKLEDGLPLGDNYERFRLRLVFPRYLRPEGLAAREMVVTRQQLLDFELDVEQQLRRLREVNGEQRKWQPTPGAHCRECPAEYACPLPRLLRPESQLADLDSVEDLERAAASWSFMSARAQNLKRRIKAAVTRIGEEDPEAVLLETGDIGVYTGRDQALLFQHRDSEKRKSSGAEFRAALEGTVEYGHPFEWDQHFSYSQGTEFVKRNVPPRRRGGGSNGKAA